MCVTKFRVQVVWEQCRLEETHRVSVRVTMPWVLILELFQECGCIGGDAKCAFRPGKTSFFITWASIAGTQCRSAGPSKRVHQAPSPIGPRFSPDAKKFAQSRAPNPRHKIPVCHLGPLWWHGHPNRMLLEGVPITGPRSQQMSQNSDSRPSARTHTLSRARTHTPEHLHQRMHWHARVSRTHASTCTTGHARTHIPTRVCSRGHPHAPAHTHHHTRIHARTRISDLRRVIAWQS